jgi:hypothetical protein
MPGGLYEEVECNRIAVCQVAQRSFFSMGFVLWASGPDSGEISAEIGVVGISLFGGLLVLATFAVKRVALR